MPTIKTAFLLVAAIAVVSASSTTADAQNFTRRGVVAGAIIGGIIGDQNNEALAGAAIGGLVGGVAGGAIQRNNYYGHSNFNRGYGGGFQNQGFYGGGYARPVVVQSYRPIAVPSYRPVYSGGGFHGGGGGIYGGGRVYGGGGGRAYCPNRGW